MQIVIEIPEEEYAAIRYNVLNEREHSYGYVAIANGTPLPKGHGDLITKEQAVELVEFYQLNPQHFDFVNLIDEIKYEKPVIEADKEEQSNECKRSN